MNFGETFTLWWSEFNGEPIKKFLQNIILRNLFEKRIGYNGIPEILCSEPSANYLKMNDDLSFSYQWKEVKSKMKTSFILEMANHEQIRSRM